MTLKKQCNKSLTVVPTGSLSRAKQMDIYFFITANQIMLFLRPSLSKTIFPVVFIIVNKDSETTKLGCLMDKNKVCELSYIPV